jgi:hypothetical protein
MSKARDRVALTLAVGICTAINILTLGVLYDAVVSAGPGLSDNAAQVLTTAFGGMIGVLGSFIGFKAGLTANGNGGTQMSETPQEPGEQEQTPLEEPGSPQEEPGSQPETQEPAEGEQSEGA